MLRFRDEQMEAFRSYMRQSFEDRVVQHIAQDFPLNYEAMLDPEHGDANVRELVRDGVKRAARYHITSERNVALFIDLMVQIAPDFDERSDMAWARTVLRDENLPEDTKMDLIYEDLGAKGRIKANPSV